MANLKNKLQHLISGQIPEYLRSTYPVFASFIQEYYKFLDLNHEANHILLNSEKWSDIDLTLDMFAEKMREQYAYDISPDAMIERRRLIKFINQYYESKGSENAAELFFRMMYNDNATIKYPGDYTLKASDGVWTTKKTIKVDVDYDQIGTTALALRPAPAAQYLKKVFNGSTAVSSVNDTITITSHGFDTGTKVRYSAGGGTAIGNLTENYVTYYVIKINANTIKLATSLYNANGGTAVDISSGGVGVNHVLTPYENARTVYDLKEKTVYLKYYKLEQDELKLYTTQVSCLTVSKDSTNEDVYELEINLARSYDVDVLNNTFLEDAYLDAVWVTAFDGTTEYVYGFLTQQLVGYTIVDGGINFKRRDTFTIESTETAPYPIPNQEVNNGLVRVKSVGTVVQDKYFASNYVTTGSEYTTDNRQGVITGLSILQTGYRFDIGGTYFAEEYLEVENYTAQGTMEKNLTNPRTGSVATVDFITGYFYKRPGQWKNNAGFLSDMNKLQDNYYYQPFSYVVQTTNTPYSEWSKLYTKSAHPAGFKVFGELLIEDNISFTPVNITNINKFNLYLTDGVSIVETFSYPSYTFYVILSDSTGNDDDGEVVLYDYVESTYMDGGYSGSITPLP